MPTSCHTARTPHLTTQRLTIVSTGMPEPQTLLIRNMVIHCYDTQSTDEAMWDSGHLKKTGTNSKCKLRM